MSQTQEKAHSVWKYTHSMEDSYCESSSSSHLVLYPKPFPPRDCTSVSLSSVSDPYTISAISAKQVSWYHCLDPLSWWADSLLLFLTPCPPMILFSLLAMFTLNSSPYLLLSLIYSIKIFSIPPIQLGHFQMPLTELFLIPHIYNKNTL